MVLILIFDRGRLVRGYLTFRDVLGRDFLAWPKSANHDAVLVLRLIYIFQDQLVCCLSIFFLSAKKLAPL